MDGPTLLLAILVAAFGYACGSVPVGVLVARATGGPDPRTIGSGRTGATNALRALGPRGAALVVVGDLLKGLVPVLVARVVSGGNPTIEVVAATAALIGSARSVFLAFGGGRGVVTLAGTMLVIQPLALLVAVPVLVLTLLISGYMSLGSLLGSASLLPATLVISALTPGGLPIPVLVYAAVGPAIVWIAHADNIDRLRPRHGTPIRLRPVARQGHRRRLRASKPGPVSRLS
jgi:glycerol-3-phosphate acyltransferase PlsY